MDPRGPTKQNTKLIRQKDFSLTVVYNAAS